MSTSDSQAKIPVRVQPNAAGNEVSGFTDGVWQIRVAAPPVKGQANKELVAFLSKLLGVGKASVTIARGHTSRNKLIVIDGVTQAEASSRLLPKPASSGEATSRDRPR